MIVLKNIIRAPKRNIILFFIAFVLAFVMMAVLFVKDYAKDSISRSMGPLSNTLNPAYAKPATKAWVKPRPVHSQDGVNQTIIPAEHTACCALFLCLGMTFFIDASDTPVYKLSIHLR